MTYEPGRQNIENDVLFVRLFLLPSQGSPADEPVPRAEGRFRVNIINPLGRLIVRGEEQLMINLIWDAQAGLRLPFIREKGQHGQSESITGKGVLYSNGVNRGDDKRFRY